MKRLFIFFFLMLGLMTNAQTADFPKAWEGNWRGDMTILSNKNNLQIPVSLSIKPIDANHWTWILYYEAPDQVPRIYELVQNESRWSIDEKNGIVLPQQFVGNRMVSSFSIGGSLLTCYYWLEDDLMNMEIHAVEQNGTEIHKDQETEISSHRVSSLQKGRLYRKTDDN